jgi:outer membrane receptor protein involved in Fe transport
MEFEDLVVNAGIRLDMRILDDKAVDYYEERYEAKEFGYEEEINKYTYAVSPRFGISHSISETSKLFFSYGHLYQLPNYTQVFDPNTKAGRNTSFREHESGLRAKCSVRARRGQRSRRISDRYYRLLQRYL